MPRSLEGGVVDVHRDDDLPMEAGCPIEPLDEQEPELNGGVHRPSCDAATGMHELGADTGDRNGPGQPIGSDAEAQHRHRVAEPVPLFDQPL
eukprot:9741976-Heterocapsa_arctica.AAC.1